MLFQKPKLECLAARTSTLPFFPSEQLLFSIKGSAGKLRMVHYETGKNKQPYAVGYPSALLLGDVPLFQIQSDFCPTCESLLAAGYGLPKNSREFQAVRAALEQPYAGLEDALERLRPVLGLLPPGIYVLSHSQYYPTDGDGHFFWDVPEELAACKATAEIYENYRCLPSFPCFLYPTQSAEKYDFQQVEHYRQMLQQGHILPPILAYSVWGYISALLDGHHRACACALEGVRVAGLTISTPGQIYRNGDHKLIWPDGGETPVESLSASARQMLLSHQTEELRYGLHPAVAPRGPRHKWDTAYTEAVRRYPTYTVAGMLGLYPESALTAEGVRRLAMDDDYEEPRAAAHLLWYACQQPEADAKELCMTFIEPGYPSALRQTAFKVLDQIKDDPEIDDLMIRVLVNCERKDDPIYQIANGHWD